MNIYKKYDIATKIAYVEKYLALKGNGNKISITKFCRENDIAKTTFYDWLSKYNNADLNDNTGDNVSININNNDNNNLPTFIELSNIEDPSSNNNNSNTDIKLSYKDVTLEFKDNQLEKVLGIIKRW